MRVFFEFVVSRLILIAFVYESTFEFVVWMASSFASESKKCGIE
jgi:hypothetical protein